MTDSPSTSTGPLREGERVTFSDAKGRRHSVVLRAGGMFHTTKGGIRHDDLIGGPEGAVATSVGGDQFLVFRPLMHDIMVSMPREAAEAIDVVSVRLMASSSGPSVIAAQ